MKLSRRMLYGTAIGFGALFLFFHGAFFGETFYFRDLFRYFVPGKHIAAQALLNAELPLWNPFIACGAPLLAEIGMGALYPGNVFFLVMAPEYALSWFIVVHYALSMIAMFNFLSRSENLGFSAAVVGSLAYTFSGMALSEHSALQHLSIHYLFPLFLLVLSSSYKRSELFDLRVILIWSLALSTGAAEKILMLFAVALGYQLIRPTRKKFASLLSNVTVGTLLAAPAWLPGVMYGLLESSRHGGLSQGIAMAGSVGPDVFSSLVLPVSFFQSEGMPRLTSLTVQTVPIYTSIYLGITAVFMAGLGMVSVTSKIENKRRRTSFWTVVFALGLLMAAGHYSTVYLLYWKFFPLADMFRYPVKFLHFSALAIAILAAYGVQAFISPVNDGHTWKIKIFGFAFCALLAFPSVFYISNGWLFQSGTVTELTVAHYLSAGLAAIAFIVLLVFALSTKRTRALIPLIIVIDLWAASDFLVPTTDYPVYQPTPVVKHIDGNRLYAEKSIFESPPSEYLRTSMPRGALDMFRLVPNLGTIWGIKYANGYAALDSRLMEEFGHRMTALSSREKAKELGSLNVRFKIKTADAGAWEPGWNVKLHDMARSVVLLENTYLMSRVRLDGDTGTARIVEESYNEVLVETVAESGGDLILADAWSRGWKAEQNDESVEIVLAPPFVRQVQVPKGKTLTRFIYRPPEVDVALGTMLISAGFLLIYRIRRSRS